MYKYKDRLHAGKVLAERIVDTYGFIENAIVLAIPNGGVPVGLQIANKLNIELELMLVRKLQIPFEPEAGFGAVSADGELVLNDDIVYRIGLTDSQIKRIAKFTLAEIKKRLKEYKGTATVSYNLKHKTVFLVDDGLASGFTMLAAVRSTTKYDPKNVVIAVPTASGSAYRLLRGEVDAIICPDVREGMFFAVADAYENWYDLPDEEVKQLLSKAPVFRLTYGKSHNQI